MTFHGIKKPGWRGFELLHKFAGTHRVPAVVTTSCDDGNASLVSALATINTSSTAIGTDDLPAVFLSFWENGGPASFQRNRSVSLHIKNAAATPSAATMHRIDDENANPLRAWEDMGSPAVPSKAQLTQLMASSEVVPQPLEVKDGACTVMLPPNSAVLVTFQAN